jgi:hypothetical protein
MLNFQTETEHQRIGIIQDMLSSYLLYLRISQKKKSKYPKEIFLIQKVIKSKLKTIDLVGECLKSSKWKITYYPSQVNLKYKQNSACMCIHVYVYMFSYCYSVDVVCLPIGLYATGLLPVGMFRL